MNATETAAAMRRLADAIEKAGASSIARFPQSMLEGEAAVGAAGMLCYLRDLLTDSPKTQWHTADVLVILETISRDTDIFPNGTAVVFWNMVA